MVFDGLCWTVGFHVYRRGANHGRRKLEHLCQEAREKDIRRQDSAREWDDKIAELSSKLGHVSEQLSMFEAIMDLMLLPASHGSFKAADVSWIHFFEEKLGKVVQDAPVTFNACDISFKNVTILLGAHVESLRQQDKQLKARLSALQVRKAARLQAQAKRNEKVKRKADQIAQEVEEGTTDAKKEVSRTGFDKNGGGSMYFCSALLP